MSPRAAWRLQSLGFVDLYDYAGGKADWLANGFPTEGTAADRLRIGAKAHRDTPTCRINETIAGASHRAFGAGYDHCVVVNEGNVVLGILDSSALRQGDDTRVETLMRGGPSTFRPSTPVDELKEFLAKRGLRRALVTKPDGRLIGTVFAEDL